MYDDNGNEIETNYYNSDGSLEKKTIYKYDDNGNTVESSYYKTDGSLPVTNSTIYEYDKKKNWVSKTILADGRIIIIEKQIEYY